MRTKLILLVIMIARAFWVIGTKREVMIRDRYINALQTYTAQLENNVPTVKQLQEKIGAEPDGIVGRETLEKWDEKICQQEAAKWDFVYEVQNEKQ